eukprot:SAG31_NODE_19197_length_609_cov_1.403922_2_plen_133_part_00
MFTDGGAGFGEAEFSLPGFLCVLVATMFAALRWVISQIMLESLGQARATADAPGDSSIQPQAESKQKGLFSGGPVVLLLYLSPAASLSLVPLVWYAELTPLLEFMTECAFLARSKCIRLPFCVLLTVASMSL